MTRQWKNNQFDLARLQAFPPPIFYQVVGRLLLSEILELRDFARQSPAFEKMARRIDSSGMWMFLLERDFGGNVFEDYKRLSHLKDGGIKPIFLGDVARLEAGVVSQEELYYKYLFKKFDAQVRDLLKFVERYNSHLPRHAPPLRESVKKIFNGIEKNFLHWRKLTPEQQRDHIGAYYTIYMKCMRFLSSDYMAKKYTCLMLAIFYDCEEVAFSLIPLSYKHINFVGGESGITPILIATMLKKEKIIETLLKVKGIDIFSKDIANLNPINITLRRGDSKVYYHALKNAKPSQRDSVFSWEYRQHTCRAQIYNYIMLLLNETTDTEEQEKIIQEALAKTVIDSEGERPSLLREYLETKEDRDIDIFSSSQLIESLENAAEHFRVINEKARAEELKKKKLAIALEIQAMDEAIQHIADQGADDDKIEAIYSQPVVALTVRDPAVNQAPILVNPTPPCVIDFHSQSPALARMISDITELKRFVKYSGATTIIVSATVGLILHFQFHITAHLMIPSILISIAGMLISSFIAHRYATYYAQHTQAPCLIRQQKPTPATPMIPLTITNVSSQKGQRWF